MDNSHQPERADDGRVVDKPIRASEGKAQKLPVIPDFHKELVKFAAYFSGTLFPVLFAMDELAGHVQQMFTHITIPISEQSQQHTVSPLWAQIFVGAAYVCLFSIYWFGRNYLRYKRAASQLASRDNASATSPSDDESHDDALREKEAQIDKFSQQVDQQRMIIKKIQAQMYHDNVRPRHDFVSFHATYKVSGNGDIFVEKEIVLTSEEFEVHFWRFTANGEQYCTPLEDETEMDISVDALDSQDNKPIPLLLENRPTRKEFTVNFLPAIVPGKQRGFLLKYKWPGFLRELVETGRTSYYWGWKAYTSGGRANFSAEWQFHDSFGNVDCENTGANPEGLSLTHDRQFGSSIWRFAGKGVPLGNNPFELTFFCGRLKAN